MLRAADIFLEHDVHIEAAPSKHTIAQGFFLYGIEPGGNRIEVTHGGYLVYDPDAEPVVWSEAERARGQAWGVQTVESFHRYGTPPVERSATRARRRSARAISARARAAATRQPFRAARVQRLHLRPGETGHVGLHGEADLRLQVREMPVADRESFEQRAIEAQRRCRIDRVDPVLLVDRLAQHDSPASPRFSRKS